MTEAKEMRILGRIMGEEITHEKLAQNNAITDDSAASHYMTTYTNTDTGTACDI